MSNERRVIQGREEREGYAAASRGEGRRRIRYGIDGFTQSQ